MAPKLSHPFLVDFQLLSIQILTYIEQIESRKNLQENLGPKLCVILLEETLTFGKMWKKKLFPSTIHF